MCVCLIQINPKTYSNTGYITKHIEGFTQASKRAAEKHHPLRGKRKMKEGLTKPFTLLKEQFAFVTCLAELFWKPEEGRILTTFLGNSAYSKNDP